MDGAIMYRKERKEVSSPKITSIFSASLVAAALAKATLTPTLLGLLVWLQLLAASCCFSLL